MKKIILWLCKWLCPQETTLPPETTRKKFTWETSTGVILSLELTGIPHRFFLTDGISSLGVWTHPPSSIEDDVERAALVFHLAKSDEQVLRVLLTLDAEGSL